jgi:hypothetical protein|tara:strand:- start:120 stop:221 length:102 start_codon:yes stop_codon:yes gene_type:complete
MRERELTLEELIELVEEMEKALIQTEGANQNKP